MASLNTLRTKYGVILSVVIILALLAFIISLGPEMGFFGSNDPTVAVIDGDKVGYTAKLGDKEVASYSFKKSYVEENGDVDDYTTYPYVNLGSLVLDGVGSATTGADSSDTRFKTAGSKADSAEPLGYNYTIQSYQNDGLYFTRKALTTTASDNIFRQHLSHANYLSYNIKQSWHTAIKSTDYE